MSCVATQYGIIYSAVEDACLAEGQVYRRWYANSVTYEGQIFLSTYISLSGDSAVGKTALIQSYQNDGSPDQFAKNYNMVRVYLMPTSCPSLKMRCILLCMYICTFLT